MNEIEPRCRECRLPRSEHYATRQAHLFKRLWLASRPAGLPQPAPIGDVHGDREGTRS